MKFNIVDSISRVEIPMRLALSGGLNESIFYEADEVVQNALRIWNKDETLANSMVSIGVGARPNVMFFRSNFAQCNEELRVDTKNTTVDGDLVFQRNGVEHMRFVQSSGRVSIQRVLQLSGGEGQMVMYEDSDASLNVVRTWNQETTKTSLLRLGCGAVEIGLEVSTDKVSFPLPIYCNNYNSGSSDVIFQRHSVEYMKFEGTNNRTAFSKDIYMNSANGVFTSPISNNLSNDLSLYATLTNTMRFYANAVEKMNITSASNNVK